MLSKGAQLDVKRLKKWARNNLALNSILRAVLLQEDNTLGVDDYLAKCSIWIALAQLEDQSKEYGWERLD